MKDFEFYQDLDLRYPELAICIGTTDDKNVGKFFIPVLTPVLNGNSPYDTKDNRVSTSNILNDSSSMNIGACTSSNYLELVIPDTVEEVYTGDKYVVLFIGGNPNKPVLLGRYYDAIK